MRHLMLSTTALALALAAAAPASAEFQERSIRVSNGVNQDHPVGDGVEAMAECLAEKSGGAMELQSFWGSALGDDLAATQALRSGTLEMVITSSSPLAGLMPALGVFDLPFLFNDEAEADAVLDGPFGEQISADLEEFGVVNLAFWENGFRNLTNSARPVTKWEDLEGMRVRVMQNNIFIDAFANMGANATPMAFGEVFSALETKAIDAQENPFVTIDTSKFSEVQDYLSVTRHAYTPFLVLYSKPLWDQLDPEEQSALKECAIVGRDVQREVSREQSMTALANVEAAGLEVNELDPAEVERMREKAAVVYEKHAPTIGPDVVEAIQAELARIRGE
ncbi:MAG: TRAP transporter substrate-binding protein [Rhodobacteraceae bacterium]|nr:TRAP transporter substrate-binding protein [Paracoccaceae bacterium]